MNLASVGSQLSWPWPGPAGRLDPAQTCFLGKWGGASGLQGNSSQLEGGQKGPRTARAWQGAFGVDSYEGSFKGWVMESLALAPVHPRLALTGLVGVVSADSWVPVHLSPALLARRILSSTLTRNKSLALPPRYENKLYFLLWQNENLCSGGRGVPRAGPAPGLGIPLGLTGPEEQEQ